MDVVNIHILAALEMRPTVDISDHLTGVITLKNGTYVKCRTMHQWKRGALNRKSFEGGSKPHKWRGSGGKAPFRLFFSFLDVLRGEGL